MKTTVLAVFVALAFGRTLNTQECAPGRVVKDLNDPYGGTNDLNGDGAFDLSDMVYGLRFLFLGGQLPCPSIVPRVTELEAQVDQLAAQVAQLQGAVTELEAQVAKLRANRGLPDTGQTKCYDQAGMEIPCDNATCPGQDGRYQTGCLSESRFVDNGDGTVTDTCTGLIWQKDMADVNGDERHDDQDYLLWCGALAYCENLSFAGHDDWRLPNVRELQSIVDYERFNPSIDPVFGALSLACWSSTTIAVFPDGAWIVSFSRGYVGGGVKDSNVFNVRAVRGP